MVKFPESLFDLATMKPFKSLMFPYISQATSASFGFICLGSFNMGASGGVKSFGIPFTSAKSTFSPNDVNP